MAGMTTGGVHWLLRAEGLALFAAGTALFVLTEVSWWWYFGLFLLPDLAFAAYLAGARAGALAYNALHSLLGPLALLALAGFDAAGALGLAREWAGAVGAIWLAHVGIDRALGYGLKYASGFRDTHLGRLAMGRANP